MHASNRPLIHPHVPASRLTEPVAPESFAPPRQSPSSTLDTSLPLRSRPDHLKARDESADASMRPRVPPPVSRESDAGPSFHPSSGGRLTPESALLDRHSERSDSNYWTPPTSMRFSVESGRMAEPEHSVVIDIPPASPHETIALALNTKPFAAALGPNTVEQAQIMAGQQEMETEYIKWAADVLSAREAAFGRGSSYTVNKDMKTPLKDALLPALYEGVSGFISSGSRSPVRNAVASAIGPRSEGGKTVGELAFQIDAATVSGAIGGVTAYAVDAWVLEAMSRRKKISNFPQFKALPPKVLVPDPSPVQLRIVNGAKEYWRPTPVGVLSTNNLPTMLDLKNQAENQRDAIAKQQQRLDGKGIFSWTPAAMTGAFNVARRALSSTTWLVKPLPVFVGSVLASSSAGAMTKFGIGMAKAMPSLAQAKVDNLVGGAQMANVYTVKAPHADMRAANWSDIGGLPRFVGETAREAGSLVAQTFNPQRSWLQAREQAMHVLVTAIANAGASVASVGFGSLFGSIERGGSLTPLPNEPLNSKAYLVQQFAQSATNDFYWNGGKEMQKSDAHALGTELDRYRDKKQETLLRAAHREQAALPELVNTLRLALSQGTSHTTNASSTLFEVAALGRDPDVVLDRLKQAKSRLETALPPEANATNLAETKARQKLLQGLDKAIRLAGQHDELVRWRQPMIGAAATRDRAD